MSRICEICGKKPVMGHKVSHANNKSVKIWYPNLQKIRCIDDKIGSGEAREGLYPMHSFGLSQKGRLNGRSMPNQYRPEAADLSCFRPFDFPYLTLLMEDASIVQLSSDPISLI